MAAEGKYTKSVVATIAIPLSPGVFTMNDQGPIEQACEKAGIDIKNVTSAGLVGREVVSLDVRHTLIPVPEQPVRVDGASMTEWMSMVEQNNRWESLARLAQEYRRRDNNGQTYVEKPAK